MRSDYVPSSPARSLNSWASATRHLRGSALKRAQFERATAVFRIIDRGRQQVGGLAITLTEGAHARLLLDNAVIDLIARVIKSSAPSPTGC